MARLPSFDLYSTLGVDPAADRASIVAAYRRAAKETHPDVTADMSTTARMARINVAREVLLDDDRRAEYDRSRGLLSRAPGAARGRGRRAPGKRPPEDPFPDLGGRVPPLDQCPVCRWPDRSAPFGHCALGHAGQGPRFGGPRRFDLVADDHGGGAPFATFGEADRHARACAWFAGTRRFGSAIDPGWGGPAEFPAVGRIRQRDGVALDPEVVAALARDADEPAVRDALAYAVAGRVLLLARYGDRLRSLVCGRHAYGVEITLGRDDLRTPRRARCSCPSYRVACKHVLATWLVWHYSVDASRA
jgi:hypothetical protein